MLAFMAPQLIGAGANLLGTLAGEWWGNADEQERTRLQEKAAALYNDVSPAAIQKVMAQELGPSALEGVQPDSQALTARRQALQQLMDIGNQGGMDAQSQLAVEQARRASAQQEASQRQGLMAAAQRRGMGANSGMALQAQLAAQQGGAERNSMAGMQAASDARSRALQALAQGGQMAAGLQQDQYAQQSNLANARDRIAQFNAQARTDAAKYNNSLAQQQWANDMEVRNRQAGAYEQGAQDAESRAQRKRNLLGNMSQVVGGVGQNLGEGWAAWNQWNQMRGNGFGGYASPSQSGVWAPPPTGGFT